MVKRNRVSMLTLVCFAAFLFEPNESLIPKWDSAAAKNRVHINSNKNNDRTGSSELGLSSIRPAAFFRPRRSLVAAAASGSDDSDSDETTSTNPSPVFFADADNGNNAEDEKAARLADMAAEAIKAAEAQHGEEDTKKVEKATEKLEPELTTAEKEKAEQERIAAEKERVAKLEEEIRIAEEERQKQIEEIKTNISEAAKESYEKFIKPLGEIKEGVSADRIKGAALAATAVTFMASKGVIASSAVGLSAAYLSISKTVAGDVMRTVGELTWDVTESAANLAEKMGLSGPKFGEVDRTVVNKYKYKYRRPPSQVKLDRIDEVELAYIEAEDDEDLARVLKEAETVIGEADAVIAKAEATQKEKELKTNQDEEEDIEEVVAEPEEDEEEVEELVPEMEDEEEETVEDEEDDNDIFFDDDEFMAAVELAQEGIEGKIVGVEDVITDSFAKAEWDAAGDLASELSETANSDADVEEVEEDEDEDDEDFDFGDIDVEALGEMARAAVEKFESEENVAYEAVLNQKQEWADSMIEEDDDDDFEDDDEDGLFLSEDSMEELAAAARAAVDAGNTDDIPGDDVAPDDLFPESVVTNWSSLKVADLKIELKSRGLKTSGKKADLVARLEQNDLEMLGQDDEEEDDTILDDDVDDDDSEDVSDDDDDLGLEEFDIEELGRQARAAVEMFQTTGGDFDEEPTEDMLAQLESEMEINGDFLAEPEEESVDISSMTVVQLKDECRKRGLKVGGKKADLIERLQASSAE